MTYVATPIAVAVREALFTSSCLFNSAVCCVQLRNSGAYLLADPLVVLNFSWQECAY